MDGHEFVVPPMEDSLLPFVPWIEDHVKPSQVAVSSNHRWVNLQAISEGLGMGFLSGHDVAGRHDFHRILPANDAWFLSI